MNLWCECTLVIIYGWCEEESLGRRRLDTASDSVDFKANLKEDQAAPAVLVVFFAVLNLSRL